MTLWLLLALLLTAALGFVVWPMYRNSGGLTVALASVIIFAVALSAGLYNYIGQPGVPSGAGTTPDVNEMVVSLANRLERNPDDVNGWQMLGRSYQTLQQYDKAIVAYEKAVALEDGQNSQTLVALALVLMEADGPTYAGRASGLLENALALDPNNPNALFYSGFTAASRGDTELAADRWEMLMGLNAPPEIQELLKQKINEWRGVAPAVAVSPTEQPHSIVIANVSVSAEAASALPDNATIYIIARDAAQPSPPIAVARRQLSELPMVVELGDRDSMVPGRMLSGFPEFELLARASVSGAPVAQAGDWFGSIMFTAGGDSSAEVVIDQLVQ